MDNRGYRSMQLDGCGKFIKYAIFIVNFIIFLGGLAILGLGAWIFADKNHVYKVLGDGNYVAFAAILMAFGGFVAFVSFLGCCGAIYEVKCLLITFFIILLIITILIIVGVVLGFKMKDKVSKVFKDGLKETMKQGDVREAWDEIQNNLKCCGVDDASDWNFTNVPDSCLCKSDQPRCGRGTMYWDSGCANKIEDLIEEHAVPLLGVGIAIAVIILLAMIFSCSLFTML